MFKSVLYVFLMAAFSLPAFATEPMRRAEQQSRTQARNNGSVVGSREGYCKLEESRDLSGKTIVVAKCAGGDLKPVTLESLNNWRVSLGQQMWMEFVIYVDGRVALTYAGSRPETY